MSATPKKHQAGISSWASWVGGGVSVRGAPAKAGGKLFNWAKAPALSAIHPRARRPHPSAVAMVQLASAVLGDTRELSTGLLVGSASGCVGPDREFDEELKAKGRGFGSPSLFVYTLPTAAVGEISIALGAHGPLLTVSAGAVSGLSAIARAIEWVETGRCERVLCGSLEFGVDNEEVVLLLVERARGRIVRGHTEFDPSRAVEVAPAPRSALDVAAALSGPTAQVISGSDPLGFAATVSVAAASGDIE